MTRQLTFILFAFAAGCAGEKAPVDDNFTDLAGLDEKSDKFTGKLTIVGSIDYGQSQGPYKNAASKWSALKFAGDAGDQVTVDLTSTNGDTVAWVLDNDFNIVAFNDDYGNGTDSHIDVKLPKNASRTHYIVTRDYYKKAMKFSVSLKGVPTVFDTPCDVDADCALVRPDCCSIQNPIAVRADKVDAYRTSLACATHQICPAIAIRDNHASAECISNKCVAVLPGDVHCGGNTTRPHACPNNFVCTGGPLVGDVGGSCTQVCGGIAGFGCDGAGQICVDDPTDSCDPNNGGADCTGQCRDATCDGSAAKCAAGYHWDEWSCGCVENTNCGGFANFPCAPGKSCVDAPDSCDPNNGGADCPGICV